jgi:hypothetical protein
MSPSERRASGEYSDDSIMGYRIGQLEGKQDIANAQNERILTILGEMRTQMALGNTRMDTAEKRLDAIEGDKRAVAGLYASVVALLGSLSTGIIAFFSRHGSVVLAALLLSGCNVLSRDEVGSANTVTTERTLATPTANGGTLTVRELTTTTDTQKTAHSGIDDALASSLAKVGVAAATGDWGTIIGVGGTALAAAATGFARAKSTAAAEHKADADEAWDRVLSGPSKSTTT